jgi:hypothetical protein
MLYLESIGTAQLRDVVKLFGWERPVTERTLKDLVNNGEIHDNLYLEGGSDGWFATPRLLDLTR